MRFEQTAPADWRPVPSSSAPRAPTELAALRATIRRQAAVISTLSEAVSAFRLGTRALKAENSELRAENTRLRARRP